MDVMERRLRAARPAIDDDAEPDLELLARVMAEPVPARRRRAVAPMLAATAVAAVATVVVLASRPAPASAISQALRWFDPPAGKVLHSRTVDPGGAVHEFWQDTDHPERMRIIEANGYETGPDSVYDPHTNTIYLDGAAVATPSDAERRAKAAKLAAEGKTTGPAGPAAEGKTTEEVAPAKRAAGERKPVAAAESGDPIVAKVRTLLAEGRARVRGRELHDGVDAWAITLSADAGRPAWTLWIRADDGRPLALDDPGDPGHGKPPASTKWITYEVLDGTDEPLTIEAAHPDAHVVRGDGFDAAYRRATSG
jgi:hypothetical protein